MQKIHQVTYFFIATIAANMWIGLNANADIVNIAKKTKVPFLFVKGAKLYNQNCSICHGGALQGTKQGPPLLHPFYKASHHGNSAFYRAALKGVRAHHWEFGDMPPVKGMTVTKMESIIPYIRWFQKENGL